jgi:hypothetical protein
MKHNLPNTFRERAEHCSQQSQLTKNVEIKRYWDELAAEWLVLENADLKPASPAVKKLRAD